MYADKANAFKARLVQLWMGNESYPVVKMWEDAGDLPRENVGDAGNLPATYINKLREFFKPKQNKLMAIREVWTDFHQGNEELNAWIARVSNAVQLADYQNLPDRMNIRDRIIRDILLNGMQFPKGQNQDNEGRTRYSPSSCH